MYILYIKHRKFLNVNYQRGNNGNRRVSNTTTTTTKNNNDNNNNNNTLQQKYSACGIQKQKWYQ